MLLHVVLFRPKPDVSPEERDRLFDALRAAARDIPTVRGFRIAQHLDPAPQYRMGGFPDLPWAAVIEFDDRAGLEAYLSHPAHQDLGRRFNAAADTALIYDYAVTERLR